MEEEDPNQKKKKIHHSLNPTDLNQMEKNERKNQIQKTQNIHYSIKPTGLNQRQ